MTKLILKKSPTAPRKKTNGKSLVLKKYHAPLKTKGSRYA